jgi:hypothetical protein
MNDIVAGVVRLRGHRCARAGECTTTYSQQLHTNNTPRPKPNKKSKEDKVWPAKAVKIESDVNCAAVHKGMKSTSRPSSRPSTVTGSADSNPHALRSADRREEVVANGVAVDDEWAPFERPDEIATAEVDKVKDKSIKKDSQDDAASGVAISEEPTASPVKHVPGKGVRWATGLKAARNATNPSK